MTIGYWDVIESEDGKKFACQRTSIFGDDEFETTAWLNSVDEAEELCEQLNEAVPDELAALPAHLR